MKFKISLFLFFCLTTLSCRLFSPEAKTGEVATYENDAFSFIVPDDWIWGGAVEDYFGPDAQIIVGIRDPKGLLPSAEFIVVTTPLPGETSLESHVTQTYEGDELFENMIRQEFKQGELSGYEIYYSHPTGEAWWEYRDIWLEKGAVIYVLSFSACCNEFENYNKDFDQILASFQFK